MATLQYFVTDAPSHGHNRRLTDTDCRPGALRGTPSGNQLQNTLMHHSVTCPPQRNQLIPQLTYSRQYLNNRHHRHSNQCLPRYCNSPNSTITISTSNNRMKLHSPQIFKRFLRPQRPQSVPLMRKDHRQNSRRLQRMVVLELFKPRIIREPRNFPTPYNSSLRLIEFHPCHTHRFESHVNHLLRCTTRCQLRPCL